MSDLETSSDEDWSDYNAEVYHEYWGRGWRRCIIYCRDESRPAPRRTRRGARCPHCYGRVAVRSLHGANIDPVLTRIERFGTWIGGWLAALWDGFQLLRWREPAPELAAPCPICEAAEWREMTQSLISQCGEHDISEVAEGQ